MSEFRCTICNTKDQWMNVDEYRVDKERLVYKDGKPMTDERGKPIKQKINMCICKTCGFITYPTLYESEEHLFEYYRKDYRDGNKPPTINSLYCAQKKIKYHQTFLHEVFLKWKDEKIKPAVCDIGAAYGTYLDWIRNVLTQKYGIKVDDIDLNGTEFTEAFVRCAYWEYGLKLTEQIDETKKYDLISSYKVLEHQMNPDEYLLQYKSLLNEGGYLYISVPTWFDRLHNFGTGGFDLNYYYDLNHINVWTVNNFENLLKKVGFKIVKENHTYYGDTYLCKASDEDVEIKYDNYEDNLKKLEKVKRAYELYDRKEFQAAIETWNRFPTAWRGFLEKNRGFINKENGFDGFKRELDKMLNVLSDDSESTFFAANIYMRYNMYDEAIDLLKHALNIDPGNSAALHNIAHCYRCLAEKEYDNEKKIELLMKSAKITYKIRSTDLRAAPEAYTWHMRDFSLLPIMDNKQRSE